MKLLSNTARFLALDAITNANSGHPGISSGIAELMTSLFCKHLRCNPKDPKWLGRDIFVLSAGHGSAILYSILHLSGYDLSLEDLKTFRQLGAKTSGHPENFLLDGVEISTGPLGQGIANAVGFAIGQKILQARYGNELFNSKVFCVVGDGCLCEGISQEAISLASHLNLDNLVIMFDNNNITIDGNTSLMTSENHTKRFDALGFDTIEINGHDFDQLDIAFTKARDAKKPYFISSKTKIGYGSSLESNNKCHGSPFSELETSNMKQKFGFPDKKFYISNEILLQWRKNISDRNEIIYEKWTKFLENYEKKDEINFLASGKYISKIEKEKIYEAFKKIELIDEASRTTSAKILGIILKNCRNMIGGCADLGGSVGTINDYIKPISKDNFDGNYIHYGIREHAMSAIMNSLSLMGFLPYSGTFLVFADYMKAAMRLSGLMGLTNWSILSHDSFMLGEDGPTHQPVEQLNTLRMIPNMDVYRPADAFEVTLCYNLAMERLGSASLILSRQKLPMIKRNLTVDFFKGAYNIISFDDPDVIIIATGSEVNLAIQVANKLNEKHNIFANVISLYCTEIFDEQDFEYISNILKMNENILRIGIEFGNELGLRKYIGIEGLFFGLNHFGTSGKSEDLQRHFKLTDDDIVNVISNLFHD